MEAKLKSAANSRVTQSIHLVQAAMYLQLIARLPPSAAQAQQVFHLEQYIEALRRKCSLEGVLD